MPLGAKLATGPLWAGIKIGWYKLRAPSSVYQIQMRCSIEHKFYSSNAKLAGKSYATHIHMETAFRL